MARRKRKSFGVLYHRGASQSSVRSTTRTFSVKVDVWREKGASSNRQFCALAYIMKSGHKRVHPRRAGDVACARTPTVVAKRALRLFAAKNWYR